MIHGDAHHLGIAAIPGNRGNGQFDGHWLALVMKHVGMRKIGGLTQHRHVASMSRMISSGKGLALYMIEERDVRGHSMRQSLFMRALHVVFQSPFPRLKTHDAPRHRIVSMHFPIVQPRQPFHVHVCDSRQSVKSTLYASVM
ncbi:uncharacterized protein TNCV_1450221 [Trichonephila clavipes]|nr:uncharacterized protein TNCV_1450221 [Trichonephila clavipes]